MGHAFVCDRCGDLFRGEEDSVVRVFPGNSTYELCEGCGDKIREFLSGDKLVGEPLEAHLEEGGELRDGDIDF